MTPSQRDELNTFWADDQNIANLESMLKLERLSSIDLEKYIRRALVQEALSKDSLGETWSNHPFTSRAELAEKAIYLSGGNAEALVYDDAPISKDEIVDLLSVSMGEKGDSALLREPVAHALLMHWKNPESSTYSAPVKQAIDEYLTEERKGQLLFRLEEGSLTSPFTEPSAAEFLTQMKEKHLPKEPPKDHPKLSSSALEQELGALKAKTEDDAAKYQLVQDLRIQAQMEMNRLMDEHKDLVQRTVVDKLKDRLKYGLYNIANPNTHLLYPSESIFGQSLAKMDSNGRVEDTYLRFKQQMSGPVIEFTRATLGDHIYAIAAQKCRLDGISRPHIGTTFRNPANAIMFMEKTVDALIKAGYDIDDISVDPHIQTAFDNYKLKLAAESFTISERRDHIEQEIETPKERKLMPEEQAAVLNEQINEPVHAASKDLSDEEKNVQMSGLSLKDVSTLLERAPLLSDPHLDWQNMQDQAGLSPTSRDAVQEALDYVGKLMDRSDPEHPNYDIKKMGIRQAEMIRDLGLHILIPAFGQDRARRCHEAVTAKIQRENGFDPDDPLGVRRLPVENGNNEPAQPTPNNNNGLDPSIGIAPAPPLNEGEPITMENIQSMIPPLDTFSGGLEPPFQYDERDFGHYPEHFEMDRGQFDGQQQMAEQMEQTVPEHNFHSGVNTDNLPETPISEQADAALTKEEDNIPVPSIHPLLPMVSISEINTGGVLIDESYKHEWDKIADGVLESSQLAISSNPDEKQSGMAYSGLSTSQLAVLAAMSHHEWAKINSSPWLTRRSAKLIERASQDVHNSLVPYKQEGATITPLQIRLQNEFPQAILPPHLKQLSIDVQPEIQLTTLPKEPANSEQAETRFRRRP